MNQTYQAPPNSGRVVLGRTIPSLLNEACAQAPNAQALNQWTGTNWQSLSNQAFRTAATACALGLQELGLESGDRVALLMYSDVSFGLADIGCLWAGLVDVPIDLTHTLEQIIFVLQHSEAKALVIADLELLAQIAPHLGETLHLQHIVLVDVPENWTEQRSQWLQSFPVSLMSLDEVQSSKPILETSEATPVLQAIPKPNDLATIIYIPDEAGQLQGVMLTHENLSMNAFAAFSGITTLGKGSEETVLSFLPLNHVLARTMLYGHILYGHSIYFSNASRLTKHLQEVQPTILVTVPIVLEKIYSKIVEKGSTTSSLLTQFTLLWALGLAKRYEIGCQPNLLYALFLRVADWLVLSKWRSLLGGRLKYVICGGAALKAELVNVFAAARIPILHGYGLTQASAVVCCNRGSFNRAGTVGVPIAGIEVAIAEDHEVLVRGPCVTSGYYKDPKATQELVDQQGWLHTGDLGTFTEDGFLKITGLKKSLFKLATGKYIAPQPIEQRLQQSPLVAQVIAVGSAQKFCAALIVLDLQALHSYALGVGIDLPPDALLTHPHVIALYQALVDTANCHLPYWAIVKRFQLINNPFTVENGLLTPTGQLNRTQISKTFAKEIGTLYGESEPRRGKDKDKDKQKAASMSPQSPETDLSSVYPSVSPAACPAFAQSLPRINRLTTFILCTSLTVPHPFARLPIY
ncbi:MAG: long-chain fatty acid--CoA ligase [Trichocoleus desertorum ATA4-8-CV12]|jgi:long-chain acyl-CoA synthetase|nr:long-chain fatty acid--CoA ligase [Trichocoleus desertorum ATA4-8-CV12]